MVTKKERDTNKMDLKEKIRLLTTADSSGGTTSKTQQQVRDEVLLNKPSADDLRKIEEGGFVQETFFKTVSGAVTQAKSKKKKKKKNNQQQKQDINNSMNVDSTLSGTTTVSRSAMTSASLPSTKEVLLMNTDTSNEPLFGALFTEPEDMRKQHWIEKLMSIRSRLA